MPEFHFALIVASSPMSHEDILAATDALGEAGCTDASIRGHAEGMELLFARSGRITIPFLRHVPEWRHRYSRLLPGRRWQRECLRDSSGRTRQLRRSEIQACSFTPALHRDTGQPFSECGERGFVGS